MYIHNQNTRYRWQQDNSKNNTFYKGCTDIENLGRYRYINEHNTDVIFCKYSNVFLWGKKITTLMQLI